MFKKLVHLSILLLMAVSVPNASAELIGWWKFDGDFVDSSGNGNIATPEGSPVFTDGMLDQAIFLNANTTDQYINCGPNMGFTTVGDGGEADGFSIAAWVNRSMAGGDHKICGNLSVTTWAAGEGFQFAIYNDRTELDMRDSTGRFFSRDVDATGFTVLEADTWYHVIFVFDDVANTLTEYINGEKTHTIENVPTSLAASAQDFLIGSQTPGFNAGRVFRGMIDDFRLYSNAVTEEEVLTIMQGGFLAFPQAGDPVPEDGAVLRETSVTLSWSPGDLAVTHDVYFGDNFDDVDNGTGDTFKGNQSEATYMVDGLVPGTTYYWRIDEVNNDEPDSPWKGEIWSFMIAPRKAFNSNPTDGAFFVDTNPVLSWEPGFDAQSHTVYFGDDADAVADDTGATEQSDATFSPGQLENEKVYYWRVDEFDGTETHTGDVWSFKTAKEGGGVRAEYFNDAELGNLVLTRIDPQIDFNWGLESPDPVVPVDNFSARWTGELEVAFTETYNFYTVTWGGVRLWVDDQLIIDNWVAHPILLDAGSIDLEAGNIYSIAMEYYQLDNEAMAELRWDSPRTQTQFVPQAALSLPVKALKPTPGNRAVGVEHNPVLTWSPGELAASHELYFGLDKETVRDADMSSAEYIGSRALGAESYVPGKLEWLTPYYWRVDEINNDGSVEVGNVWSFTTADFLVVDNFEDYNDYPPNEIWNTWIDGYGVATNGSTAGYPDPDFVVGEHYMEVEIVHGGSQSMPVFYDNVAGISEVTRTFDSPDGDWTREGVAVLTLFYYGDAANDAEPMYIAVDDVVVTNSDPEAALVTEWTQWDIPLSEIAGINPSNVGSMTIGFGNKANPLAGGDGHVFFDDIRLYRP